MRTRLLGLAVLVNAVEVHGAAKRAWLPAGPVDQGDVEVAEPVLDEVGVRVVGVVEDSSPFRRRFQPSHPDADQEGYVSLPNVDTEVEMTDMLNASRAYQANLTAIGLIRDLNQRALDLGK